VLTDRFIGPHLKLIHRRPLDRKDAHRRRTGISRESYPESSSRESCPQNVAPSLFWFFHNGKGVFDMYGLPDGVIALNDEPYNIQQQACWYCYYPSNDTAASVLQEAFCKPCDPLFGDFQPKQARPIDGHARVTWSHNGETFDGEVLVDKTLKPVGFRIEIVWSRTAPTEMVFNLSGQLIPGARFEDDDPVLLELVR